MYPHSIKPVPFVTHSCPRDQTNRSNMVPYQFRDVARDTADNAGGDVDGHANGRNTVARHDIVQAISDDRHHTNVGSGGGVPDTNGPWITHSLKPPYVSVPPPLPRGNELEWRTSTSFSGTVEKTTVSTASSSASASPAFLPYSSSSSSSFPYVRNDISSRTFVTPPTNGGRRDNQYDSDLRQYTTPPRGPPWPSYPNNRSVSLPSRLSLSLLSACGLFTPQNGCCGAIADVDVWRERERERERERFGSNDVDLNVR
jgi:hypothetical protein